MEKTIFELKLQQQTFESNLRIQTCEPSLRLPNIEKENQEVINLDQRIDQNAIYLPSMKAHKRKLLPQLTEMKVRERKLY